MSLSHSRVDLRHCVGMMMLSAETRAELRKAGMVAIRNREDAAHLDAYHLRPDVVVDVGVDRGTPRLYKAFPEAFFVLVDPIAETFSALKAEPQSYDTFPCAAGAMSTQLDLRIPVTKRGRTTAMAGFREITGPLANGVESFELRTVPVEPLDAILAEYSGRVGLKIDTEGFERDVLDGAQKTLARTDFVLLELSLTRRFEGIGPPSEIIARLARHGLELRDIISLPGDGRGGPAPRYIDALFTRWNG